MASHKQIGDKASECNNFAVKQELNSNMRSKDFYFNAVRFLTGAALGYFFTSGYSRLFGIYYLELLDLYEAGPVVTNLVIFMYYAGLIFAGPLASMLLKRYTVMKILISMGLLTAIGHLITSQASNIIIVILSLGTLHGIAEGLAYCCIATTINTWFTEYLGLANSVATVGAGLGVIVLPPTASYLAIQYGSRGLFLIMGAIALHACVSGFLMRNILKPTEFTNEKEDLEQEILPSSKQEKDSSKTNDLNWKEKSLTLEKCKEKSHLLPDVPSKLYTEHQEEPKSKKDQNSRICMNVNNNEIISNSHFKLFLSLEVLSFCYLVFCFNYCLISFVSYIPAFTIERGLPEQVGNVCLSISGISDIVFRLLEGFIFTYYELNREILMITGALITGTFAGVLCLFPQEYMIYIFGIILGAFGPLHYVYSGPIIAQLVGKENLRIAFGIFQILYGLSGCLVPLIVGGIKKWTGRHSGGIEICSLFYISGAVIFLLVRMTYYWKKKGKEELIKP